MTSIVVRGSGRKKWKLTLCIACKGHGRQELTKEQVPVFGGYPSINCPECDGQGYQKEITYMHNIGAILP